MSVNEKISKDEQKTSSVLSPQSSVLRAHPPVLSPQPSALLCPTDELLIAYLCGTLVETERAGIDQHLRSCDSCVETASMMHRRLSIASEVAAPVPAPVRQRAGQAQSSPSSVLSPQSSVLSRLRDRLSAIFQLPVLVPVAVAAAALLVVATQQNWSSPVPSRGLSRSIQRHEMLRVRAPEAVVRQAPGQAASVIVTLRGGVRVEVVDEQGEWYRVVLDNGTQGWVERQAFE